MRLLTLAAIAMAFVVASCDSTQSPTQATPANNDALNKTYSTKYHNSGIIYNDCCGEEMTFEADIHQTLSDEIDKKGVHTYKSHINTGQVVLTGSSSGLKYVGSQNDKESIVWQPSGCPASRTYTSRFKAIATGSGQGKNACSFNVKVTVKESLDADCNYSLDVLEIAVECE